MSDFSFQRPTEWRIPITTQVMKYEDKGQLGKHKEGHLTLNMSEDRLLKGNDV